MSEERNLFGMLDQLSAKQDEVLNEVLGIKTQVSTKESKIAELEQEIQKLKNNQQVVAPKPVMVPPKKSNHQLLLDFLKSAKKSWRWFGSNSQLQKWKTFVILSYVLLLIVGLITTIVSSICFKLYSTFTLFENGMMICCIFLLVYAAKTKLTYEASSLAANSPDKYGADNVGMLFPRRERKVFKVFRWLAIISVICNVICIWAGMGKDNKVAATIMEILFLTTIILSRYLSSYLFAQYCIIEVEGRSLSKNEPVIFLVPPGAKELIPEEDFKKMMPDFYR